MNSCFCLNQVDSSTESAEAACDILSQLVNCTIKTLGLISTARSSFMDVSQVSPLPVLLFLCNSLGKKGSCKEKVLF